MRLIDADKLQKDFQQKLKYCMEWKKKSTENESRADAEIAMIEECMITIDCQPTIDAVPREWLLNKLSVRLEFLKRWRDGMPDFKKCTEIKIEDCEEIIDIIKSYE